MNEPIQQVNVAMTPRFHRSYAALPPHLRRIAERKIALLSACPAHPSLKVHRIKRCAGLWSCAVTDRYRILFERNGEQLTLIDIGKHAVIDHVHHHGR